MHLNGRLLRCAGSSTLRRLARNDAPRAREGGCVATTGDEQLRRLITAIFISFIECVIMKGGCVYIMTNSWNTVFYAGVTSDLNKLVLQHKLKHHPKSFTARYNLTKPVYYQSFEDIIEAIREEKSIKAGSRAAKLGLIQTGNPDSMH